MEAASVDLSEATIKNMRVKDLKGGLKSRRLLQIGRKAELQDQLIHVIKDKVPIAGVVENTKNKSRILRSPILRSSILIFCIFHNTSNREFVFYCMYQSIPQFRFPSNL